MIYNEVVGNLFDVEDSYYLAHCISSDFAMGMGIAVDFNKRFNAKRILMQHYSNQIGIYPNCLRTGRVFNLVTKDKYWNKPTYGTLRQALCRMRNMSLAMGVKRIAMPMIGCGLDKLSWEKVRSIIKEVFADTEIEILVVKKS